MEERVDGADLVDRDPERAVELLADAHAAVDASLERGRRRRRSSRRCAADRRPARRALPGHPRRGAERRGRPGRQRSTTSTRPTWSPPATARSGSWRRAAVGSSASIRPTDAATVDLSRRRRSSSRADVPGDPWLIATAATDVVVIDRERTAWRIDLDRAGPAAHGAERGLAEPQPGDDPDRRRSSIGRRSRSSTCTWSTATTGEIRRWSPPAVIPVTYPDPAEPFLTEAPDLDPREARDLRVDVNAWLLHADTVTRVDFGIAGRPGRLLARPPTRR